MPLRPALKSKMASKPTKANPLEDVKRAGFGPLFFLTADFSYTSTDFWNSSMKKLLAILLLFPTLTWAQNAPETAFAYVTALQPPAWIVIKEQRAALGASDPIPNGATLITGPGARVHVALADGSLLKLGENTTLNLFSLQLRPAKPHDILSATLKLADGSLRYTTKGPSSIRTELTLQVGSALAVQTAAADLFGVVTPLTTRLALLSGNLTLTPSQKPVVPMAQPNTVYTANRGKAKTDADGITAIAQNTLGLASVEFDSGHPALQSNGPYRIVLARYAEDAMATARVRLYSELGYPVELQKPTATQPTYRVVLDGLSSESDARHFAELLKQRLKLLNPLIESLMPTTP